MEGHVYKVVELVGSSPDSVEDAVSAALKRAGETLRQLALVRSRPDSRQHQ